MLAGMMPRQFDEWLAMYDLEPWAEEWRQTGTVAAEVGNGFQLIVAAFGGGVPTQIKATDYYRRTGRVEKENGPRRLTPEESLRKNRMLCGV